MSNKYITLKNLAKISGFASDYIGFLIRKRKIFGRKLYSGGEWKVSKKGLLNYIDRKKIKTTLRKKWILGDKYLSLKEAAGISGYASDYIGYLIRKGKVPGKKNFSGISWVTTEKEIEKYQLLKNKKSRKRKYSIPFIPSFVFGRSFYFSLRIPRYVFVFAILGLFIFGGLVTFAFTSKKPIQTVEIYPLQIQGDPVQPSPQTESGVSGAGWKNPQNVLGQPDVLPNGDFNSFSELNSAVYQNGSLNLISTDFKATEVDLEITKIKEATTPTTTATTTEATTTQATTTATTTEELISEEATSTLETTSTPATTTESTTTETTTTEATTTSPETTPEATSTPESTSTPEELPEEPKIETENQTSNEFNKTSTEESLIEQPQNETSNETEPGETGPAINPEPETAPAENPDTPTSFFEKIKNFFEKRIVRAQEIPSFEELINNNELLSVKIKFSFAIGEQKNDLQLNPEINPEGTTTPVFEPSSFWQKFRNFFSNLGQQIVEIFNNFVRREKTVPIAEASDDNLSRSDLDRLLDNSENGTGSVEAEPTITEPTITEPTINESTTPTVLEATTIEEVLPSLDAKVIIWWSVNGSTSSSQGWQILDTISSNSLSNALNGGYFEYNLPHLKSWEDIKNLKIKFEGVVGGETYLITYLDSVWVEVEYQEKGEEEEFELRAIKKDWRADEEPEFEILAKGKKENIVEKLGGAISSVFEEKPKVEAVLIKPQNNEISLEEGKSFSAETHSPTRIKIFKEKDLRPGLHKIKIEYEKNGKVYNFEQEFTWGVLGINVNKSIYLPNEKSFVQMTVLDDQGHTLCDAELLLEIIAPDGKTAMFKTSGWGEGRGEEIEATSTETTSTETTSTETVLEEIALETTSTEATSTETTTTFLEIIPTEATSTETQPETTSTEIQPAEVTSTLEESTSSENFATGTEEISTSSFQTEPENIITETTTETADLADAGRLSTSFLGEIQKSNECGPNSVTYQPDYYTHFMVAGAGKYQLKLTAITKNGTRQIEDSFEVRESVPFDVERIGPTRIFPPSPYQMTLKIKANQDFEGVVKEYVPEGFEITADNLLIYEINRVDESTKVISWNVNWKAGENYELKYQFDAPDISPYLYLLGPLEFTENSSQPTFKEIRQWQIAADAITYQTPGALAYSAAGGTSVAPAYPASIAAGDLLVLIIGMKPSTANSGSVTTPDGWTAITNGSLTGAGGYGTTLGGDTGNTNVFTYYKVAAGTETGSLTVTIATNNVSWAQMYRFSTSLTTMVWSVAGATGTDIVGNTTVSIAMTSDPGVTGGDYIIGAMCIPTDVTTPAQFSAEALSQTGVTFGTVTEISEPDSDIGNDIGGVTYRAPVNSGTSSATSTFTATAGGTVTNVRGPGVFIRIREIPIPSAPTLYNDDGGSNQIAFNNIHTSSTTPIFRLSATHTATFNRFQIEINDNPTFGDAAEHTQNFDSTYSSGTQYNLTISGFSPTNNTTYYVRARASGNGGSNYGNWSTSTWSYTYSTSATTAKWFQTTDAQFDTGTLASTVTDSPNGRVKLSGWLSGWAKRVKLTIDHNDISASLSNFPFLVYLSTSTGRGSDDVSFVFDELGANSKKIAVTKSDGTNQLYVEIEKWNSSTEQAWLWVNATGTDSISSTTDTDFYLYYDSAQADNTTYVGDSGSRPEVWDSNYVMVQHLEETTGTIVDSTGKNNCSNNGMVLDAAGKIDGGDQSATNTANLNCGSDSSLQPTNAITVEAWGKSNDATEDQYTSLGGFSSSGSWTNGYGIFFNSASTINFFVTSYTANVASAPIIPQDWNYVVGTYDKDAGSNQVKIYVNATAGTPDTFSTAITYGGGALTIAQMGGWTTDWLNGYVDEFRISNIARSDSWIKASYETGRDHLLDFGSAEIQENTIMSPAIDYDWLSGAGSWNQFTWIEDEAAGTVSMQLYYKVTTDCDTIVPDAALSGNSTGFASGPVSISSLNTATYNRLCLKATLTKGTGTPYLQDWTVTWAAAGPNLIQNHYRWRNDDGGESTSTWLASEDNATNTYKNTNTRLRFSISNTGSTATDYYYRIEYSEKTATSCENQTSGWSGVPTTTDSNIVTMTTSTYFNNGATTTRQLSTTTGTFVSGKMVASTTNQTFAFTLNQNEYTEHEYLFKFTENATYTTYCFRLTNAGSITDFTYTINAEATISAANQAPTVNSVSLNGGSTIYLIAGSATTVSAVASVSDSQDCSTISTTTAKIYREGVGSGCAASSSNCYIIDFCAQDACVGNNATYTCTTSLQFFADPTDEGNYSQSQGWNTQEWIAWVKVIDNQNASSTGSNEATEEVDVATLLASELSTTTINYGEVKPNETSTEKTVTIKTIGNVPLDVNASGTNMAWNGNNIGVPWQHYSTTTGFSWDTGTPLSTTTQPIELESGKPTQSPTNATDDIYWKLKVPLNTPAGGPYQGTAIFIEIQD